MLLALTLDNLANRYHCLPSEALARASTLDLYVLDVSAKWFQYQQQKAAGELPKSKRPSEAEMIAMIKRVKGEQ